MTRERLKLEINSRARIYIFQTAVVICIAIVCCSNNRLVEWFLDTVGNKIENEINEIDIIKSFSAFFMVKTQFGLSSKI